MNSGGFVIEARDEASLARAGRIRTAHGEVETPVFMPVATQGAIKAMAARDLAGLGAQILLANSYHLCLRPGVETIAALGGLHRFMGWDRAILTDSGGYQIFSLAALRQVTDEGVVFRSHLDGSRIALTPEDVVQLQAKMGVDILMPLDECPGADADRQLVERAMRRTLDWAARSRRQPLDQGHLLYGIVQGGVFSDLRRQQVGQLAELDFPGYAVGGLSVGEEREVTREVAAATAEVLPEQRPRYLMGVGLPQDLLRFIAMGYDQFDCVLPTRNARNGMLFTSRGALNIRLARNARDAAPVDENCACYTCKGFSRAYLRHLAVAGEMLAAQLATLHNLHFYLDLMAQARSHIRSGDFSSWATAEIGRMEVAS